MPDLAREFFERDLDDAEWQELGRQLEAEDAVKDRFLERAEAYWLSLGPTPGGGGALGGLKGLGLGLLLGAAAGGGGVWLWRTPPLAAPVEPAPVAVPAPTAEAIRPRAAATLPPTPQPLASPPRADAPPRQASPGYPHLAAVIELDAPGLVTARVLGPDGQERRLLFAGLLDPGRWSFGWDGKDEVGRLVEPGAHIIEVQAGSRVMRKQVLLDQRKGAP